MKHSRTVLVTFALISCLLTVTTAASAREPLLFSVGIQNNNQQLTMAPDDKLRVVLNEGVASGRTHWVINDQPGFLAFDGDSTKVAVDHVREHTFEFHMLDEPLAWLNPAYITFKFEGEHPVQSTPEFQLWIQPWWRTGS